jgi:hypothetical protein
MANVVVNLVNCMRRSNLTDSGTRMSSGAKPGMSDDAVSYKRIASPVSLGLLTIAVASLPTAR